MSINKQIKDFIGIIFLLKCKGKEKDANEIRLNFY